MKKSENKGKILIATSSFGKVSLEPIKILEDKGYEIILNKLGRVLNESELSTHLKNCVAVIAGTEKYNKNIFKKNKNLKVISRLGVGLDNIDLNFASEEEVAIYACSTSPATAVAELVIGLFLNLSRNVSDMNEELKAGIWNKKIGSLFYGKTVGIIGLGDIGKKLVEITQSFKLKYLAFDLKKDKKFSKKYNVNYVSLENLLENSNFITIHLNGSKENKNFIDSKKLSLMKNNPILVNTSRGDIIDEKAIKAALKKNIISGLGLDVFSEEPFRADEDFLSFNNVIFTPHVGAYASEIRTKMEIESVKNLLTHLENE